MSTVLDVEPSQLTSILKNPETKESYIDALSEVYGRTTFYRPNASQLPVHKSPTFERWIFGGNGLGKDTLIANETVWHALGTYPDYYPKSCRIKQPSQGRTCSTNFNDGILNTVVPELTKWAPKGSFRFKKDTRMVHWTNGSTTQMKSFDQDIQSFAGANLDYVNISEHQLRAQYDENLARLRGRGVKRILGVLTPTEGQVSWEFDMVYEKYHTGERTAPELEVFGGSTYDNISNLSEAYVKRFDHLTPDERRMRLHGEFVALEGLVYPEYRDWNAKHIRTGDTFGGHLIDPIAIPSHWARYMAIDPHPRKSFAMLWLAISPTGDHVYYDEFYLPPDSGLLVKDYAKIIKQREGNSHGTIRARIIDSSARSRDPITGVDIQAELAKHGIRTRTTRKADKDHSMGFDTVREGMHWRKQSGFEDIYRPRILIFDSLKRLRYEFRHYTWDSYVRHAETHDVKPTVKKINDDMLDCLRYLEMSNLTFDQLKVTQPWLLKKAA